MHVCTHGLYSYGYVVTAHVVMAYWVMVYTVMPYVLSRPAKVTRYWAFAGLGSKMPANVCPWYQKAGLGT